MNRPLPQRDARAERGPRILIVGGGASGVLLARHLLAQAGGVRVALIEDRYARGCGVAYSTPDPEHLLNTRVHNMSAFPDDPLHFHRWLAERVPQATPQCFVSRSTYGAYLAELLTPWEGTGRIEYLAASCLRLEQTAQGVVAHLADGRRLPGDVAVLATGHVRQQPDPQALLSEAWDALPPPDPQARVLIIGCGLSMVDQVLSLLKQGHRGEILAVSRRGQLPRAHVATRPLAVAPQQVPLGAPIREVMRWARGLARAAEAQGGTWRDAVDGIRPHVRALWVAMPPAERERFLRHAATWWDVHRHRMPPQSAGQIEAALTRGQLRLERAAFLGALRQEDGGLVARFRSRGAQVETRQAVARIIDCRGIRRDPGLNASPLMADLLARGIGRIDPLRIGLDVDQECRLMAADGCPSARLRAIGPASRAAFWEITAIPDIREQVARLALDLSQATIAVA